MKKKLTEDEMAARMKTKPFIFQNIVELKITDCEKDGIQVQLSNPDQAADCIAVQIPRYNVESLIYWLRIYLTKSKGLSRKRTIQKNIDDLDLPSKPRAGSITTNINEQEFEKKKQKQIDDLSKDLRNGKKEDGSGN